MPLIEETPTLYQQAEALFGEAAQSTSLLDVADEHWPTLYKISFLLEAYSKHVGYPELIINPDDGARSSQVVKEYTAIKVDRDKQFPNVHLWQISMRQEQERAMLHGRSAKVGESWQYISFDTQHAKSSEFIRCEGGLITNFVLRSLVSSNAIEKIGTMVHGDDDHQERVLSSTGVMEVSSARKKKTQLDGQRSTYAQIDELDLPQWVTRVLTAPIDDVNIRTRKK